MTKGDERIKAKKKEKRRKRRNRAAKAKQATTLSIEELTKAIVSAIMIRASQQILYGKANRTPSDRARKRNVCYMMKKWGSCSRGENCKYFHDLAWGPASNKVPMKYVCKHCKQKGNHWSKDCKGDAAELYQQYREARKSHASVEANVPTLFPASELPTLSYIDKTRTDAYKSEEKPEAKNARDQAKDTQIDRSKSNAKLIKSIDNFEKKMPARKKWRAKDVLKRNCSRRTLRNRRRPKWSFWYTRDAMSTQRNRSTLQLHDYMIPGPGPPTLSSTGNNLDVPFKTIFHSCARLWGGVKIANLRV